VQLAAKAELNPNPDQLARMFDALSLAAAAPPTPGRFVDVVAPSGFDALAGVTPATRVHASAQSEPDIETKHAEKRRLEQERRQQREAEAQFKTATHDLERARDRVRAARESLERAEADVADAEREVAAARERLKA
jgi:septal ring factor EnvC (AmiA/AmiB activator)